MRNTFCKVFLNFKRDNFTKGLRKHHFIAEPKINSGRAKKGRKRSVFF